MMIAGLEVPLTVEEAAKLLRATPATVRGWCRDGLLPGAYLRRIGRSTRWLIPKDVVLRKLELVGMETAGAGAARLAEMASRWKPTPEEVEVMKWAGLMRE